MKEHLDRHEQHGRVYQKSIPRGDDRDVAKAFTFKFRGATEDARNVNGHKAENEEKSANGGGPLKKPGYE